MMFKWMRSRWLVAVAAVVVVAFIVGLAFGLSGADRTIAQEGSTDLPYPDKVATPDGPIPTMDLTKNPIIAEREPSNALVERVETTSEEGMETDSNPGNSTKPATGNYLYLPKIDRYYSLPDDVELERHILSGTCIPETRCPDFALLIYRRGEARIGIDQVGEIFETVDNADASAFPFFTGKEDQKEGQ